VSPTGMIPLVPPVDPPVVLLVVVPAPVLAPVLVTPPVPLPPEVEADEAAVAEPLAPVEDAIVVPLTPDVPMAPVPVAPLELEETLVPNEWAPAHSPSELQTSGAWQAHAGHLALQNPPSPWVAQ
jgi:hypothetical protein